MSAKALRINPTPSAAATSSAKIPGELLIAIIAYLAQPELAICAGSSRVLYDITTPLLYRVAYIELAENINPLFNIPAVASSKGRTNYSGPRLAAKVAQARKARDLAESVDREAEEKAKAAKGSGKKGGRSKQQDLRQSGDGSKVAEAKSTSIAPPIPIPSLTPAISLGLIPSRFSYTTHLTLTSHSHTICDSLPPLTLPLLQDLRIRPVMGQNHLDFCHCLHFTEESGRCTQRSTCLCPLISELRPSRLIVGDDSTGLTGSALGLTYSNFPYPPEWIKKVVVFAGYCTGIEIGSQREYSWVNKIPPTVERLSIVLQPREGVWARDGRWRIRHVAGWEESASDAKLVWNGLGRALSGNAGMVEVVGLETVDRDWTVMILGLQEEEVRKALKCQLFSKGWAEKDAEERVKALRFVDRREFNERLSVKE